MKCYLCAFVVLLFFASPAFADFEFGGHVKGQISHREFHSDDLQAVVGSSSPTDFELDTRLNAEYRPGDFEFTASAEYLAVGGDMVDIARQLEGALQVDGFSSRILPDDERRLFDLTLEVSDGEIYESVLRFDRLAAAYLQDEFVIRLGRQAITWGNGLVFQVLDLFNPFSPTEIDKDYKSGDDMLYAQWLFDSGADLQLLYIPRRAPGVNPVSVAAEESSFAVKFRGTLEPFEYHLVVAQHYDERVFGAGVSTTVLDALWRADVTITELDPGDTVFSLVTNLDRSWVILEKNFYGYLEFFHSGVGSDERLIALFKPELLERIERGELFTIGKNYLALGLRYEHAPLLNFFSNTIFNLNDESGVVQLRSEYDLTQNVSLLAGVDLLYGSRGSEFGGLALPSGEADNGAFVAGGQRAYLRGSYYF